MAASRMSNWDRFGIGATGGGMLGAGLMGMMGGHDNPANAAMPYLNEIPGETKPYYQPYIDAGNQAVGGVQQQFQQLINNPNELYKRFGQGFQQSPGYQWQLGQGEQAINNAMASQGMAGSPQHGQFAGQLAGNLANQDFYKYIQNVMGLYGSGLSGEQGIARQGQEASQNYANLLGNVSAGKGEYAYGGKAGQNQAQSQDWSNIFGGLGSLATLLTL